MSRLEPLGEQSDDEREEEEEEEEEEEDEEDGHDTLYISVIMTASTTPRGRTTKRSA